MTAFVINFSAYPKTAIQFLYEQGLYELLWILHKVSTFTLQYMWLPKVDVAFQQDDFFHMS